MGRNLLGRGALASLDAGLCDLAVSPKCAGRRRSRKQVWALRRLFTSNPCLGIVGRDQKERWTGIPKGIESACQFGVRLDGSGRDNGARDL